MPAFAWLLGLALAGCDAASPPASPTHRAMHQLADGSVGRIEWRGALACADCDGIDTQLVLRRAGNVSDYTLVETYLAADQGARFAEHGHWQRQSELLQLQGDGGSFRIYALMADGRLQPRDGHGQPLPPRENDFLAPVSVSSGP